MQRSDSLSTTDRMTGRTDEHDAALNDVEIIDCCIVGGGIAGLTAVSYLQRFKRHVKVVDAGHSRAAYIPLSHNMPGVDPGEGISGIQLLQKLRHQAEGFGADIMKGEVVAVKEVKEGRLRSTARRLSHTAAHIVDGLSGVSSPDGYGEQDCVRYFILELKEGPPIKAQTVLIATGIDDKLPGFTDIMRAGFSGLYRHCPICDAYEIQNQNVFVLGNREHGPGVAKYLRTYTPHVTFALMDTKAGEDYKPCETAKSICDCAAATGCTNACADGLRKGPGLSKEVKADLEKIGVQVAEMPVRRIVLHTSPLPTPNDGGITKQPSCTPLGKGAVQVEFCDGAEWRFDTMYSALGGKPRTGFLDGLGVATDEAGNLAPKDTKMCTNVPGIYCAGDVATQINQIAVAMGHAAAAGSAIHNYLTAMGNIHLA